MERSRKGICNMVETVQRTCLSYQRNLFFLIIYCDVVFFQCSLYIFNAMEGSANNASRFSRSSI